MLNTYVINLETCTERRENISKILSSEKEISFEFIEAVDGRKLSEIERDQLFNVSSLEQRDGWKVLPGEIGCTLSHQKCYKKLLNSDFDYVLILEDDIVLKQEISPNVNIIADIMKRQQPVILLLSGMFWYSSIETYNSIDEKKIAKVIDATMTHSYVINRAAAELLINQRPSFRADDWRYIISKGVAVYGLIPHLVNQDNKGGTTISVGREKIKGCFMARFRSLYRGFVIHLLTFLGRSEPRD